MLRYGCNTGSVPDLTNPLSAVLFFAHHKAEINSRLSCMLQNTGYALQEPISGWDRTDPLALETRNQSLLARFGYESAASQLLLAYAAEKYD